MDFNVPRIIRFKDSFGNEIHLIKKDEIAVVNMKGKKEYYLRPGDTLELEVEIDNSFDESEYALRWRGINKNIPDFGNTKKISLLIEEQHICEVFKIQCVVISNKSWHRKAGYDDVLYAWYTVLPNIYNTTANIVPH